MAKGKGVGYLISAVGDVLSAVGVPAGTATKALNDHLERRARRDRDIILAELRSGDFSQVEFGNDDDALDIAYRIARATTEGRARANLRLLARILCGLSERGPVYASDFARYEKWISDLSHEEILVIGTLSRKGAEVSWNGVEGIEKVWEAVEIELVPGSFKSNDHIRATAFSAQRSGLLMQLNNIDAMGYLVPSPLLKELVEFVKFDDGLFT